MRASITCPSTGKVVAFEVKIDAKTAAASWKKFVRMQCPHCSGRHAIPYKEVYVDGVLANLAVSNHTMFTMLPDAPTPGVKQQ
jgi:hypothetical protein